LLRKQKEILIRKPSNEFSDDAEKQNEHIGYSEIVESYNPLTLKSIKEVLSGLTLKQGLDMLLKEINIFKTGQELPNIFCNEKILLPNSLTPFNPELGNASRLIFQDQHDNVESFDNNIKNFVSCFFKITAIVTNVSDLIQII